MTTSSTSKQDNRSVLVVEDDVDVRRFLVYALQHLGFRVSECGDVQSAERFLENTNPDIVLTDCNLPRESGTDLVRRKHEDHSLIGMSGECNRSGEMLEAGALDFLQKPIALNDLKDVIERHREAVKEHKAKVAESKAKAKLQQNGTRAHLTNAPNDWMRDWSREQRRRRSQS